MNKYSSLTLTRDIDKTSDGWKCREDKLEISTIGEFLNSMNQAPHTPSQFTKRCSDYGRMMLTYGFSVFQDDSRFSAVQTPLTIKWFRTICKIDYETHKLSVEYRIGDSTMSRESTVEEYTAEILVWATKCIVADEQYRKDREDTYREEHHQL